MEQTRTTINVERLLTTSEVADMYGYQPRTIRKLAHEGTLEPVQLHRPVAVPPLRRGEADRTKQQGGSMNGEISTDERGVVRNQRIRATVEAAIQQGRAREDERGTLERTLAHDYEDGIKLLLARKPNVNSARHGKSFSEQAWEDYAVATGIPGYRPTGYARSVV